MLKELKVLMILNMLQVERTSEDKRQLRVYNFDVKELKQLHDLVKGKS